MDSYRCDADQVIFHHECIQMADISECPFYGNQLRPQSPAIVCTSSVIMKAKSGRSPATDVDVDGPAESVLVTHKTKRARINITGNDYPVDVIEENIRCDEQGDYDRM
ncbi:hypothetical protein AHF37_09267 [Paragonimus kellicotti]|nr:hypothetical protein AHF37_09267 [Paragonimus kellicotti]